MDDLGSSIQALLSKKSTKYDIFFYDNIYAKRFSEHLVDLKEHLPKNHMDMYNHSVIQDICSYEGKWVGLVCIYYIYIYIIFLNQ